MKLDERVALDMWAAARWGMDSDDVDEVIRRAGHNPAEVTYQQAANILIAAERAAVSHWRP